MSAVAVEVDKIRSEPSSAARSKHAQQLADQIRQNKLAVLDGADIDLLANLLTDRDDSVRYWIAMALGYLGPRARQSVPALEKALKERECDHSSKTSASGIEFALSRIGVMSRKPTQTGC
jgi:HEAT repeat protein